MDFTVRTLIVSCPQLIIFDSKGGGVQIFSVDVVVCAKHCQSEINYYTLLM